MYARQTAQNKDGDVVLGQGNSLLSFQKCRPLECGMQAFFLLLVLVELGDNPLNYEQLGAGWPKM